MGKHKKKGKKGWKKKKKKKKKMSTGKMLLIGAGVAAVAVGTYFVARWAYKHGYLDNFLGTQQTPLLQDGSQKNYDESSRQITSVAPELAPYVGYAKDIETSNQRMPLPGAVTFGLGWDVDSSEQINVDLVAAAFNSSGVMLGYVQGYYCCSLFNGAITHTGDDTKGGTEGKLSSVLGDNENIILEFQLLPNDVYSVVVGVHVVQPYNGSLHSYCHMLPLFREEQVATTDELRTQLRAIDVASESQFSPLTSQTSLSFSGSTYNSNPYSGSVYNSSPYHGSTDNSNYTYSAPTYPAPTYPGSTYNSSPYSASTYNSFPVQPHQSTYPAYPQAMNKSPYDAQFNSSQSQSIADRAPGNDSDDSGEESEEDDPQAKREARQAFIRLFHADLDSQPNFMLYGGFVPGKCQRDYYTGKWTFQPIRQTVQVDPNQGIWPSLTMYALQ